MDTRDAEISGAGDDRPLEVLRATARALARDGRIGAVEFAELVRVAGLLGLPAEAVSRVASEAGEGEAESERTLAPAVSPPSGKAARPQVTMPEDAQRAYERKANHFGPEVAEALPKYILIRELGQGGMGVVWKAWQTDLPRYVAIKFVGGAEAEKGTSPGVKPADVARHVREAYAGAGLSHPNILPLYEAGEHEGRPYLAFRYIEGGDLSRRRPKDIRQVMEIVKEAAEAIAHAHAHGIIHRDVKPQNILLSEEGEVYVMDFGLAARADEERAGRAGTPEYMSPEQARAEKADERSDVYGLGATLYFLVTGRSPHEGGTREEVLKSVREKEPASPRRLNRRLDSEVEAIIQKAIKREPGERYQNAGELADDLGRFLHGDEILDAREHAPLPGWGTHMWRACTFGACAYGVALFGFWLNWKVLKPIAGAVGLSFSSVAIPVLVLALVVGLFLIMMSTTHTLYAWLDPRTWRMARRIWAALLLGPSILGYLTLLLLVVIYLVRPSFLDEVQPSYRHILWLPVLGAVCQAMSFAIASNIALNKAVEAAAERAGLDRDVAFPGLPPDFASRSHKDKVRTLCELLPGVRSRYVDSFHLASFRNGSVQVFAFRSKTGERAESIEQALDKAGTIRRREIVIHVRGEEKVCRRFLAELVKELP